MEKKLPRTFARKSMIIHQGNKTNTTQDTSTHALGWKRMEAWEKNEYQMREGYRVSGFSHISDRI